jgi:hypothetical protein
VCVCVSDKYFWKTVVEKNETRCIFSVLYGKYYVS